MKARDVMVSHVITVGPELDVKAVANTLMANGISAVPVVAIDGSVVGIISEGDLMRRAVSGAERKRSWWLETFSSAEQLMAEFVKTHGRKAKDVMTRRVISVDPDTRCKKSLISSKSTASSGCPYSRTVGLSASSAAPISCRRWRAGGWVSSTLQKRTKSCEKS